MVVMNCDKYLHVESHETRPRHACRPSNPCRASHKMDDGIIQPRFINSEMILAFPKFKIWYSTSTYY